MNRILHWINDDPAVGQVRNIHRSGGYRDICRAGQRFLWVNVEWRDLSGIHVDGTNLCGCPVGDVHRFLVGREGDTVILSRGGDELLRNGFAQVGNLIDDIVVRCLPVSGIRGDVHGSVFDN